MREPCAEPCAGALWASPLEVFIWWSLTNSFPEKVVGGDKCLVKCLVQALCGLVRSFQRESVVWGAFTFPMDSAAFPMDSSTVPTDSLPFFVDSLTFAMDSLTFLEDSLQKPPGLV